MPEQESNPPTLSRIDVVRRFAAEVRELAAEIDALTPPRPERGEAN